MTLRSASSVLLTPHLRLAWLLAVLLWATGTKQPVTAVAAAPASMVLRSSSAHHPQPGPMALIEQLTLNREAVAPSLPDVGNGPQAAWALPAAGTIIGLAKPVAALQLLPVRPCAVPDIFRVRLLVAALAPNAP